MYMKVVLTIGEVVFTAEIDIANYSNLPNADQDQIIDDIHNMVEMGFYDITEGVN